MSVKRRQSFPRERSVCKIGKEWTKEYELQYWLNERDKTLVNDQVEALITEVFTQVSEVRNR